MLREVFITILTLSVSCFGEGRKNEQLLHLLERCETLLGRLSVATPPKRIDSTILDTFDITGGNVGLNDAQVILIGEAHHDKGQLRAISEILNKYASPGDLLMLEAAPHGAELRPETVEYLDNVNIPIKITGWENMDAYHRTKSSLKQALLSLPTEGTVEEQISAVRILKSKLNDLAIVERNSHLRNAVVSEATQALPKGKKVFLIAGHNHLTKDPLVAEAMAPFRHVVLIPKVYDGSDDVAAAHATSLFGQEWTERYEKLRGTSR